MPINWNVKGMKRPNQEVEWTDELVKEYGKCARDIFYFAENYYTVIEEKRGKHIIKLFGYQKKMLKDFVENRFNVVCSARQMGKALSLDTPILTTSGFKKLSELHVGDMVYGRNGKPTKVTFITETMWNHNIWKLTFYNGDVIKADEEHQWEIKRSFLGIPYKKVVNTKQLIELLNSGKKVWIKPPEKVDFEPLGVEIDPWVMGFWIGSGSCHDGIIRCERDKVDKIKEEFDKRGYKTEKAYNEPKTPNRCQFRVTGLKQLLYKLHLIENKIILDEYSQTSYLNRKELLLGIIDSCGYLDDKGNMCIHLDDSILNRQLRFVLSSMGILCNEEKTSVKNSHILKFNLNFNTLFFKKRKGKIENKILIKEWKQIDTEPVRCLQVDNKDHLFLAGESLIPTHNTTCSALYLLWYAIFEPDKTIGVLANKEKTARSIVDEIKLAWLELPDWLKPGVEKFDQLEIKFDNGSLIMAGATSSDSFRGESLSLLFLDEFGFIPENVADAFFTSAFPTISQGGRMIIVSTPNGAAGKFYDIYTNADKMGFSKNLIRWDMHPDRDEEWKERTLKILGKIKFSQEHNCSFAGSTNTLIDGDVLTKLKYEDPPYMPEEGYYIWKKPSPNRLYMISCDVGKGSGSDYSVANIYDVTDYHKNSTYEQVAMFRKNDILLFAFKDYILKLAKQWYTPGIIIEENGLGSVIANSLFNDEEYEFVYYDYDKGSYGVNANSKTKPLALTYFKEDVEGYKQKIHSEIMLKELNYFEEVQPGIFRARPGKSYHDDCVASGYWMSYALRSRFYEDFLYTKRNINFDEVKQEDTFDKDEEILDIFQNSMKQKYIDQFQRELRGYK